MKIVFLDRATIADSVTLRKPEFSHDWKDFAKSTPEQAKERLMDADIAVVNKVKLTRDTLRALPKLKMIAVTATGTDNVDLEACREFGIEVRNVAGYAKDTVAEHTFALILTLRRAIPGYIADVARGDWQASGQFCIHTHPIKELRGSRMALVGGGAIGQAVAGIARAFGMEVAFTGRKGTTEVADGRMPFDEALGWCDILSLHCPLEQSNAALLGLAEFQKMARAPIVINTARGGLIVEEDLATALREGLIAGAGVDAASVEPPAADHPFMSLLDMPNFILTPHVAWAGEAAMQTVADSVIASIGDFIRSE
ncbi:D-2-hydroxyacid dehydrogenase [Meridianimarinicoccus aquatilis]|uniref:D-2-hydroxyacid dehydrogenase n=1 Tax=Meridianimarinicoccus aquatilis TaxID=2552766 RepID=A0A4R6AMP0_9RHOB|nr:D-2-hydroxyacid dehydrogenase [Fluviibacterium aquatile]TDL85621.1 D-2-hydroxyacid dehydrogenase [Fluviibacterium aquatile]